VNLRYALSNYLVMIALPLCLILDPHVNNSAPQAGRDAQGTGWAHRRPLLRAGSRG
jgi:hypothetical protein